jgi:hypothetical protein
MTTHFFSASVLRDADIFYDALERSWESRDGDVTRCVTSEFAVGAAFFPQMAAVAHRASRDEPEHFGFVAGTAPGPREEELLYHYALRFCLTPYLDDALQFEDESFDIRNFVLRGDGHSVPEGCHVQRVGELCRAFIQRGKPDLPRTQWVFERLQELRCDSICTSSCKGPLYEPWGPWNPAKRGIWEGTTAEVTAQAGWVPFCARGSSGITARQLLEIGGGAGKIFFERPSDELALHEDLIKNDYWDGEPGPPEHVPVERTVEVRPSGQA